MTGFYPDVPGPRMAIDRDGTVGFYGNSNGVTVDGILTATQMGYLSSEAGVTAVGSYNGMIGVIFPEPRDIVGWFIRGSANTDVYLEKSTDTTNGGDGTWTTLAGPAGGGGSLTPIMDASFSGTSPYYRSNITTGTATGIVGLRIRRTGTTSIVAYTFHFFGSPTTTRNPALALWHPTSNAEVTGAYFDWGNVARSTNATRTFRVKNVSSALTASGITVGFEALTPGSPSIVASHTLSTDNITFTPSISISNLAAGAISPVLYLKRSNPSDDQLGARAGRLIVLATAFS